MNRFELAAKVAEALPGVPVSQVEAAVKLMLGAMSDSIASGEGVEIRGFGRFSLRVHPPRQARNPKTGELFMAGERRATRFKAGKEMRERVDPPRKPGTKAARPDTGRSRKPAVPNAD